MNINPFKRDFPTSEEVTDMYECSKLSPDAAERHLSAFNLLFTYGSLQRRGCMFKEHLDQGSAFVARAFTVRKFQVQRYEPDASSKLLIATASDDASMRLREDMNKGFYEGWANPKGIPPCIVQGEIHAVDPGYLDKLDKTWQNTVAFDRTRVELVVPYRPHPNPLPAAELPGPYLIQKVWAWIFLGVEEHWEGQDHMKPATILRSKDFGPFYILK